MTSEKNMKITRENFIEVVDKQIGDQFVEFIDLFEDSSDHLVSQSIGGGSYQDVCHEPILPNKSACQAYFEKYCKDGDYLNSDGSSNVEKKHVLVRSWIGLLFDVIKAETSKRLDKVSDIENYMAETIYRYFTGDVMISTPVSVEGFFAKAGYIMGIYPDLNPYADNDRALYYRMRDLGIFFEVIKTPESSHPLNRMTYKRIEYNRASFKTEKELLELASGAYIYNNNRYMLMESYCTTHVQRAYIARNSEAHNENYGALPIKQRISWVESSVITCLMAVAHNATKLILSMENNIKADAFDSEKYCRLIMDEYQNDAASKLYYSFQWELRNLQTAEDILRSGNIKNIITSSVETGRYSMHLLLGRAGIGKTFAMKHLEYILAANYVGEEVKHGFEGLERKWIPVFVSLRDLDLREGKDIQDILYRFIFGRHTESVCAESEEVKKKVARELMDKGRLAIILDGIDELPMMYKGGADSAIKRLHNANKLLDKKNLIVVTDRDINNTTGESQPEYLAMPLNAGAVDGYIKNYIKVTEPECESIRARKAVITERVNDLYDDLTTALKLALATEIAANDAWYGAWKRRLEAGESKKSVRIDLEGYYVRSLIEREAKKTPELGGKETVEDNLWQMLTAFEKLRSDAADGSQDDSKVRKEDLLSKVEDILRNSKKVEEALLHTLALEYVDHMVSMGLLKKEKTIYYKDAYCYASEAIAAAMEEEK